MKSLKGWITTIFLTITLTAGTVPASAGIIFTSISSDNADVCTDSSAKTESYAETLINGLTGIIFGFASTDNEPVNCGIIFGERK